jgi:hypothetical protein
MAKTLKKRQVELELDADLYNADVHLTLPPAGSWRRMRVLAHLFRGEAREARDQTYYYFWHFVEWYGPTRAEWYWHRAEWSAFRGIFFDEPE